MLMLSKMRSGTSRQTGSMMCMFYTACWEQKGNGEASFFLHTSNICSAAIPPDTNPDSSATWTQVTVPCVNFTENWRKHFGNESCDLLKIDIEGSELDFLRNEAPFLKSVQTILIEWHKWRVSLNELKTFLTTNDFSLKTILHEDAERGTAVFAKNLH